MGKMIRCKHCKQLVPANPHIKDQLYCGRKACQRARKAQWQLQKMHNDHQYAQDQNNAKQQWRRDNPDYWKNYRNTNTKYTDRNRNLQKLRDQNRRQRSAKMDTSQSGPRDMDASIDISVVNTVGYPISSPDLAKMDASDLINPVMPGCYRIGTKKCDLAKMDASKDVFIYIPISCVHLAKMDRIDIHIRQGANSAP